MKGRHSFTSYIRDRKEFILTALISISTEWFLTLKVKAIRFIISVTQTLLRIPVTLKVKKVKFVAYIKGLQRIPITLKVKKIKFVVITRLLERWAQTLKLKKINFVGVTKALVRFDAATLYVKKIKFAAVPIVAQFRVLNYYSGSTLSQMDGSTLADLDYVVIP